jgi:cytidylate kinase
MTERHIIVTLDGPAGVGKTTLAQDTAEAFGLAYLDTGAMFRATARQLGEGAWELEPEELRARMAGLHFELAGVGRQSRLLLNGHALSPDIRSEEVGLWASNLATLPVVREFQKAAQQAIGRDRSLVAEGRDMGTVVFPHAAHKFFLDATPEERALRRHRQLAAMGRKADLDALAGQIRRRDEQDRGRAVAPLRPAPDALVIDTTNLTKEQVFDRIQVEIRSKAV